MMKTLTALAGAALLLGGLATPAQAAPVAITGSYGSSVGNCGTFKPGARHGAVFVVGDSITVMGRDRLPTRYEVNARSGRNVDCLAGLLRQRKQHATPKVVVIALGTNAVRSWKLVDYRNAIDRLPKGTNAVLVTTYRQHFNVGTMRTYARWMRALAKRPDVFVADWRAYIVKRRDQLSDGTHPTAAGERAWARIVIAAVERAS